MSITNEVKQEIIAKYGTKPGDTGSPEEIGRGTRLNSSHAT